MIHADPTTRVLDKLEGVTGGNGQWQARCPAHDDGRASLSITCDDDGKAAVYCHAGCDGKKVLAAIGLELKDLYPPQEPWQTNGHSHTTKPKPRIVQSYDYRDEDGELVFQAVRLEPKDFRQRKPDGRGGFIWSVKGCPVLPYRLCDLRKSPGARVYIPEGERDVENLFALGLLATCNAGGAEKWRPEHAEFLRGHSVVIFADNDDPGRRHALQVAKSLVGIATSIKVVNLPGLPTKGDVSDWINSHGDSATPETIAENLQAIVDATPEWNPDDSEPAADEIPPAVTYQVITCKELAAGDYALEYLIEDAMVAGQPLIIAGQQKVLKTSFIIAAAIALATAGYFLGKLFVRRAVRVAVMSGESGLATIQETAFRIAAASGHHLADIENLLWSPDVPKFGDVDHLEAMERFLVDNKIEVLFLDPAYLCLPSSDSGNLMAQGELLRGMAAICQRLGVTMVLAHHTKKNTLTPAGDPPELSDIAWAGFAEFARQWWLIGRREKYKPGSGEHKLWLSVGGSAGHSGLWGVDVSEGVYTPSTPRRWDVEVRPSAEIFEEKADSREESKRAKAEERAAKQAEADRRRVVGAMQTLGRPETKNTIRGAAQISGDRTNAALHQLEADNQVRRAMVERGNNQRYEGFELIIEDDSDTRTDSPGQNSPTG